MRISIKNIGKISEADIEIDGITVVAGENNTGKSTIGKILFCFFDSLYQLDMQIEREKRFSIIETLEVAARTASGQIYRFIDSDDIAKRVMKVSPRETEYLKTIKNLLDICFDDFPDKYKEKIDRDNVIEDISEIISLSPEEIINRIFYNNLRSEFNTQIMNVHSSANKSIARLQVDSRSVDDSILLHIMSNEVIALENCMNLQSGIVYIDDPYIIDNPPHNIHLTRKILSHRAKLRDYLHDIGQNPAGRSVIDEILTQKKLGSIADLLDSVCPGNIVRVDGFRNAYRENHASGQVDFDMANVSTGLKSFAIMKTLLQNGHLKEHGVIILDEPETHLHPAWQLMFAELIVLLQKEFKLHILLNSHSPYFIDAIDVFSRKHGISDICKYYLAEEHEQSATFSDVSEDIDRIYKKLYVPFQVLEDARYK